MATTGLALPIACPRAGEVEPLVRALTHMPGVAWAYVNPLTEMAYVEYNAQQASPGQIAAVIARSGYGPAPAAARVEPTPAQPPREPRPGPERPPWPIALALLVGLLAALGMWRTSSHLAHSGELVRAAPASLAQAHAGGMVTIRATWDGPSAGPVFAVAMASRAVDLGRYDLARLAVLRVDGGLAIAPAAWSGGGGAGWRSGTLLFPARAADGRALLTDQTREVELLILGGGGPERIFHWCAPGR